MFLLIPGHQDTKDVHGRFIVFGFEFGQNIGCPCRGGKAKNAPGHQLDSQAAQGISVQALALT